MVTGPASAPGFRADIEGLRALAILLVVAFHAGIPGFSGGFLGVDVFFVISGYLITSLLVEELDRTGRISLRDFYARRVRRLLPASTLMIAGTLVAGALLLTPLELEQLARTALATALYVANFFFIGESYDYFAPAVKNNPLLHTWSLAIEEQFYLVWPAMIATAFAISRSRRAILLTCAGLSVASYAAWALSDPMWSFYGPQARAWEFSVGALASFVAPSALRRLGSRWCSLVGIAGLVGVVGTAVLVNKTTPFPGPVVVVIVIGTAAVLFTWPGAPAGVASRVLCFAPMLLIGRLSYGWYLWHWPVLVLAKLTYPGISLAVRVALVLVALGVAALSYVLLERPIRCSAYLRLRPFTSLGLAVVLTTASVGFASRAKLAARDMTQDPFVKAVIDTVNEYSPLSDRNCLYPTTTPIECDFAQVESPTTLLLFGDSVATQWFSPLKAIAEKRGWRLLVIAKAACSIASPANGQDECSTWLRAAVERILMIRPAVVVTSTSGLYTTWQGEAAWREGYRRTLSTFDKAGIPVMLLSTTPATGRDVPSCVLRAMRRGAATADCEADLGTLAVVGFSALQRQAVAGLVRVTVVDLLHEMCDGSRCPAVKDGVLVYQDGTHITHAYARTLAPLLGQKLDAEMSGLYTR